VSFQVNVSNVVGALVVDGQANGFIVDDEPQSFPDHPRPGWMFRCQWHEKAGRSWPAIDLEHDDNNAAPAAQANEMSR
jgi:hypothetical protein